MKILNKEVLVGIIEEFLSQRGLGGDSGEVISNEPVADVRNYDPDDKLVNFDEQAERIIGLIHDLTSSVRGGLKSGDVSQIDGEKIKDFPIKRIQRALNYVIATIDAYTGEELDMTTPEV